MSWQSQKDEDRAFNSLSSSERQRYFRELKENEGRVDAALDATVGPVWFDKDGDPKGSRNR